MVGAAKGELREVDFPALSWGRGGGHGGAKVLDVSGRGGEGDSKVGVALEDPGKGEERDEVAVGHEREHHYVATGISGILSMGSHLLVA